MADFNALLAESRLYQASSIHSRPRVISPRGSYIGPLVPSSTSTPPLLGQTSTPPVRTPRERRLLSDLWLMSAATFRRMGKYDEARAAIQDAEKHDEGNEGVWVQVRKISSKISPFLTISTAWFVLCCVGRQCSCHCGISQGPCHFARLRPRYRSSFRTVSTPIGRTEFLP